jgi:hypothetical protein
MEEPTKKIPMLKVGQNHPGTTRLKQQKEVGQQTIHLR